MIAEPTQHQIPKCNACGYVGLWTVEPFLLPRHWLIGGLLLFAAGAGLGYWLVVIIMRSDKNNRAKICSKCHARNLFTFLY